MGRAAGVPFADDFTAELDRAIASFPPAMRASMANDLEAGNRLELDWLAGKVVALGRKYAIATPTQDAVYAILKPFRMGRPKSGSSFRVARTRGIGGAHPPLKGEGLGSVALE